MSDTKPAINANVYHNTSTEATPNPFMPNPADPANIDYYRRFGFEIIEPALQVFPKEPSYIGMTRPAPERLGGVPVASTHRTNQRVGVSAPGASENKTMLKRIC